MAVALSSYSSLFSVLSSTHSTVKFRYSHRPIISIRCSRTTSNPEPKFNRQEVVWQKKQSEQSKDERSTRGNVVGPKPTSYKSTGMPRKDKDFVVDSKDQQVESSNLQDSAFLNAVVKVYCTHTAPDYSLPWQKQRQFTSTGSAFIIGGRKLLTNAHCVEHDTQVKVKRRGDDSKYVAKVLARGVGCDLALLSVENEEFWRDVEPLRFGRLPHLQWAMEHA